MFSNLLNASQQLGSFLRQVTETLGFGGCLGILLGVELLFVIIFGIRAALSYESRLKRSLDKANQWLFKYKVVDTKNIKAFNEVMKAGPKRLAFYWQQYILYREGAPSKYMNVEDIIEKPLKTSTWNSSVRNLTVMTVVWSVISLIFGLSSQILASWSFQEVAVALVFPCAVLLIGAIAIVIIRSVRSVNLDDTYHIYYLFARFVDNACADLPPFIDFDLLFTAKEIENGNPQLRQYYEERARKAKEEFEAAKKNDIKFVEYNFENVGVDGKLLLNRAMKESETYINKKTAALAQIAQAEAQKDALRRNYENVQMDLQRKIQASKENIQKLIEQQAATTSRIEVGLLRQQQDKESKKQEALQKDYDQEETRYKAAKGELDVEVERLSKILVESLDEAEKGMSAEYQSFFEKVMKSAYAVAEKKTEDEKKELKKQYDISEKELVNVQTQIKRLLDENMTLRDMLAKYNPDYQQESQNSAEGHYDDEGNFVYADGSYHTPDGLFHDVDGRIYDINGVEVTEEQLQEEATSEEAIINSQINQFGSYVLGNEEKIEQKIEEDSQSSIEEPEQPEVVETPVAETVEEKIDSTLQEEKPATEETKNSPAKKRGRPRKKTVSAQENKVEEPKKSRGRPRKNPVVEEIKEEPAPAKKRGRPRKTETVVEKKPTTTNSGAKRGRPKGSVKKKESVVKEAPKKRGRPRKSPILGEDINSLSKISQLISEEEEKLNKMKALLNSEIDEVMKKEEQDKVDQEREDLIKAVEALKAQAEGVDKSTKTNEDLSNINKRLEDLIKEIATLNNKK